MDELYEDELDLNLTQDGEQYLFFKCDENVYSVDALRVIEIIEYQSFTKVPMMQKFVKGVTNVRGDLIAVVDLKKLFNFGDTIKDKKTSMIIVKVKNDESEIKIAIIIDEVLEAKYLSEADMSLSPEFGVKIDSKFIYRMCKYGDTYIPILNIDKILNIKTVSKLRV